MKSKQECILVVRRKLPTYVSFPSLAFSIRSKHNSEGEGEKYHFCNFNVILERRKKKKRKKGGREGGRGEGKEEGRRLI